MKGPCHVWFPEDEEEKQLAAHLLAMENKARHDLRLHLEAIARPALALIDINVLSKRRNPEKCSLRIFLNDAIEHVEVLMETVTERVF